MATKQTQNLTFQAEDISGVPDLPDFEYPIGVKEYPLESSVEEGFIEYDGSTALTANITTKIQAPTFGEADVDYPASVDVNAEIQSDQVTIDTEDDIEIGNANISGRGPSLGSGQLSANVGFDALELKDISIDPPLISESEVGGFTLSDDFTPELLDFDAKVTPQTPSAELDLLQGQTESIVSGSLSLPSSSTESSDTLRTKNDDDELQNLRVSPGGTFANLTIDLDQALTTVVPQIPPLGIQRSLFEDRSSLPTLEIDAQLLDLDASGDINLATDTKFDPDNIAVELRDQDQGVVQQGTLGDSFTLPRPTQDSGPITLTAEYTLQGRLIQELAIQPDLNLPLRVGDLTFSASASALGFDASASVSQTLFDTELLGLAGIDASTNIAIPSTRVETPLSELDNADAFTVEREIRIPVEDGPTQTASTEILDEDGDQIGELSLELPTFSTDSSVEYGLTLSTQQQAAQFNFAFIVDQSGSMSGQKLSETKAAFNNLISFLENEGIADVSRFGVVPFNDSASLQAPLSTSQARDTINGLSAGGGTLFGPPLARAATFFQNGPDDASNIAYFLSDGKSNEDDETSQLQSVADVRAFGIGDSAELGALDVIDSNQAVQLQSASDLADAFQQSGFATEDVKAVQIREDNQIVDTIGVDEFNDTAVGLKFEGTLKDVDFDQDGASDIEARAILDDGTTGGSVSLEVTDGGASGQATENADTLTLGASGDSINGRGGDDDITGNDFDNMIRGGKGDDVIDGARGDDVLEPGPGDDTLLGGPGIDVARYNQPQSAVGPVQDSGNLITVGTGTDTLNDVEFVKFSDTRIETETLEPSPVVTLETAAVKEPDSGTRDATLTFELSSPLESPGALRVKTQDDTAESGRDFKQIDREVQLPAGVEEVETTLPVIADSDFEGRESLTLKLSGLETATFANNRDSISRELDIGDADEPATLSTVATPAISQEPVPGSSREVTFTVRRSGETDTSGTVDFAVKGAGVSPADVDDTAGTELPSGSLTFSKGETREQVRIDVTGDDTFEARESIGLFLSNPSDDVRVATPRTTAVITDRIPDDVKVGLRDSDSRPNVVAADAETGDEVGLQAVAEDANPKNTTSFSLRADANGRFDIDSADGTVTVADGDAISTDLDTTQTITVVAEEGAATFSKAFDIRVAATEDEIVTAANQADIVDRAGAAFDRLADSEEDADSLESELGTFLRRRDIDGPANIQSATPTGDSPSLRGDSKAVDVVAADLGMVDAESTVSVSDVDFLGIVGDGAVRDTDGATGFAGDGGEQTINAGGGDDRLFGGGGDDVLRGGPGADRIVASAGDRIVGGLGEDAIRLNGLDGNATWVDPNAGDRLLIRGESLSPDQVRVENEVDDAAGETVARLRVDLDDDGLSKDDASVELSRLADAEFNVDSEAEAGTELTLEGSDFEFDRLSVPDQLAALYVGYFGRIPDPGGFQFWQQEFEDAVAQGVASSTVLRNISESFRISDELSSQIPEAVPPGDQTGDLGARSETIVTAVFENLFDRQPTSDELGRWKGQIEARLADETAIGDLVVNIAETASNGDDGPNTARDDATTLRHKIEVGQDVSRDLDVADRELADGLTLETLGDAITNVESSFASFLEARTEASDVVGLSGDSSDGEVI